MELIKIVDKRNQKLKELEDLMSKVKLEKRELNQDENTEFTNVKTEVESLNKQIDDIQEADKRALDTINQKNNNKKMTNFSLLKTVRDIVEGRNMNEETMEFINAGKNAFSKAGISARGQIVLPTEYRQDIVAQTALSGQEIVAEQKMPLLTALKAKTILGQAGATFYTGLVGDVSIPVYAGTSSTWVDEISGATNGGGAFSEVTLAPKRLTTYIDISKQFLAQDGINAEAALMQDLVDSILVKVENTVFDATVGGSTRPAGLFYGADYSGTLSGTTTWAKLVGIKAAVDTANALTGNLAYVTTPALAAVFETTSIDAGGGVMCMNAGKVGGYPVLVTSNVNSGKVAFGNWNDYVVGQWGGMDITVDPYTQAVNGKVRIIVNTFWDFKVRRSASFKLSTLS